MLLFTTIAVFRPSLFYEIYGNHLLVYEKCAGEQLYGNC